MLRAPVDLDRRHVGEQQRVGVELACEQGSGEVLVDYSLDAA
jgi:hypothetical protein